ncbi:PQQ-binding-like beta-propeller repeat protein [Streptomyces sp. NPDC056255]|uniref:outer membrane protein assembly factor BamB family protein n=1 Tax=Streptomyces sp. NPDC056255 TaxID=3345764 RepID=UPI0035DFA531
MGLSGPFEARDPERVGPYRIVRRLGEGGMGRVYLGLSRSGREFAVKVVRPELSKDPSFLQRFAREVAAARAVSGAFTAPVVDAEVESSPAWLATSYVRGSSLADSVAVHGGWPEAPLLVLAAGLAEALESIHRAGVVHRDLKPSNVLLGPDGPLVIDFGISLVGGVTALTAAGQVVGTVGFMSPEQLTGRPVSSASDVFSLGAVVAFAAGGEAPFGTGSVPEVMFRSVYEEPDVSSVPSGLRDIVCQCLAKDSEQRPTVGALLDELAAVAERAGGLADWREFSAGLQESGGPRPTPTVVTPEAAQPPAVHEALTRTAPRATPPGQVAAAAPAEPAAGLDPLGGTRPASRRQVLSGLAGIGVVAGLGIGGWAWLGGGSHDRGKPTVPDRLIWDAGRKGAVPLGLAMAGDLVYVNTFDGYLTAQNRATGKKRWACSTGGAAPANRLVGPAGATPAIANGLVYVGSAEQELIYAIDAESGKHRWTADVYGQVASPLISADTVVACGEKSGLLCGIDASTGRRRWLFGADNGSDISTPTPGVSRGTAYVGSGKGDLYAVNIQNGKQRWKFHAGGSIVASPAVSDGTVFASDPRKLFALDTESGRPRWTIATAPKPSWSPAVSGGYVYFADDDDQVHAVSVANGKERWRTSVVKGSVTTTPTVANGVIYLSTDDIEYNVYAIDAATGRLRWKYNAGGYVLTRPVVDGNVVYVGGSDGHVYALRA